MIVLHPAWSQGVSDSAAQSLRESAQRVDALLKIEEARLESKARHDQRELVEQKDASKVSAPLPASDVFEVLAIYGTPNDLKLDLLVNGLPSFGLQKGDVVKGWRIADISAQSSCAHLIKASASAKSSEAQTKRARTKNVGSNTGASVLSASSGASRSLCWDGTALAALLNPVPAPAPVATPLAPNMPLPPPPPVSSALPPGATEPRATSFVARPHGN